jgi:pimeloyl-ACP methyl ester carboxylesterase
MTGTLVPRHPERRVGGSDALSGITIKELGQGPVVVLLHGIGGGPELWNPLLPALSERMRVLVPDLSGALRAGPRAVAEMLDRNLAAAGVDACAVVGHGAGGLAAEWLALLGRVQCLILIDAGPAVPGGLPAPDLFAPGDEDVARIDVPALVLWGEDDPFLGVALADRLSHLLPHATQVLLPGCGHFVLSDAGDTVSALVAEFLRVRYLGLSHDHGQASGPVPVELRRVHGPA